MSEITQLMQLNRDLEIIEAEYPYKYCLNRSGIFWNAHDWAMRTFEKENFTYIGPTFFFKRDQDYMWFMLKWN